MNNMNGLILLADGFEDSEALTTRDMLLRAHFNIHTASINNDKTVLSSHNLTVIAEKIIDDINFNDYDFLILPGGLKGVNNLKSNQKVINLINNFLSNSKDVHAICAAPSILGLLGYLNNLPFTCYPGFEKNINGKYTGDCVTVVNEHIITAKSMAYSIDFALEIIKKYCTFDIYQHVSKSIRGL